MSKFVGIRVYKVEVQDIFSDHYQINIEFVYDTSSKIKNFIRKNIVSDYGSGYSRAGDKVYVVRPTDFYEFRACLKETEFNPEKGGFKIWKMVPTGVKDEETKKPKFVEGEFEGTIDDVFGVAKHVLTKGYTTAKSRDAAHDRFDIACKDIIDEKTAEFYGEKEQGEE